MVDSVNASMSTNGMTEEEKTAHEAKMVKAAEDGATTLSIKNSQNPEGNTALSQVDDVEPGVAKRPDDVPEKFWDAEKGVINTEALLKSQKDGETALRATHQTKPKEGADDDDSTSTGEVDQQATITAASTEFAEKGELTAETYDALEKSGLSKGMVDEYIAGQVAIRSNLESAAYGAFDGAEGYDAAVDWAVENLSEAEIEALDVQITSMNPAIVKQGSEALAAKFAAGADITPDTTITGGGNNPNTGVSFKSGAEMRAAMADPQYKKDSNFRNEVANKIAAAGRAGIDLFA